MKISIIICLILLAYSCDKKDHWWQADTKEINLSSLHRIDIEELSVIDKDVSINEIYLSEVVSNHLVMVEKIVAPFIHIYDLKTNKVVFSIGELGRGPGEFEAAFSLGSNCDSNTCNLVVFDLILQRITEFEFERDFSAITDTNIIHIQSYSGSVYEANRLNNYSYFGLGFFDNGRIQYFDERGESRDLKGNIPEDGKKSPPFIRSQAFLSRSLVNENNDLIAVANRYSDRIELYNSEGRQNTLISGPEGFMPEYELDLNHSNARMSSDQSMKLAFIDLCSNNHKLFALYSGRTRADSDITLSGNLLFTFDWETKSYSSFELPDYATTVSCSKDSNDLFLTVPEDSKTKLFAISLNTLN